jgi:hypothetical protein
MGHAVLGGRNSVANSGSRWRPLEQETERMRLGLRRTTLQSRMKRLNIAREYR